MNKKAQKTKRNKININNYLTAFRRIKINNNRIQSKIN